MKREIEETIINKVDVDLPYYAVSENGKSFFCVLSEEECIGVHAFHLYEKIGWDAPENALVSSAIPITKEIFEREFEIVSTIIKNKVYAR